MRVKYQINYCLVFDLPLEIRFAACSKSSDVEPGNVSAVSNNGNVILHQSELPQDHRPWAPGSSKKRRPRGTAEQRSVHVGNRVRAFLAAPGKEQENLRKSPSAQREARREAVQSGIPG